MHHPCNILRLFDFQNGAHIDWMKSSKLYFIFVQCLKNSVFIYLFNIASQTTILFFFLMTPKVLHFPTWAFLACLLLKILNGSLHLISCKISFHEIRCPVLSSSILLPSGCISYKRGLINLPLYNMKNAFYVWGWSILIFIVLLCRMVSKAFRFLISSPSFSCSVLPRGFILLFKILLLFGTRRLHAYTTNY